MSKRILVTSTDLMMAQFLIPHMLYLAQSGFDIEIACSDVGGRMEEIRQKLQGKVNGIHVVRLVRSPSSPSNLKGYRDMKRVISAGQYDIIWTNEPVMGVVTRLAARNVRKNGVKVLYMVHGFHFYKGAPKINWMVYYPIEMLMASYADAICAVNQEDYARAKKMHVKQVEYIHGIGINTSRLTQKEIQKDIRSELGLGKDAFLVLSVGELNENKNQKTVIKAIAGLKDPKIHYILCGKGDRLNRLKEYAEDLKIADQVHFLGYRRDVADICSQSDVFAMPSYREGLPVAALEAMYCGLPLVTSKIRGLSDVMKDGVTGYLCQPDDAKVFAERIAGLKSDAGLRTKMAKHNKRIARSYCIEETKTEVLELLLKMLETDSGHS